MVVATRVMYLMSGVLMLASGVYIELSFASLLSETARLFVALTSMSYFAWQFWRFVNLEWTGQVASATSKRCRKLGLDFSRE